MKTHRYHNNTVPGSDLPQKILRAIHDGGQIRLSTIASRWSVTRGALLPHMRRLMDSGKLVVTHSGRHRLYAKSVAVYHPRLKASIGFSGRITIGRGLAFWGTQID